jgi:UDP-glucose 4-epimerase
MTWLLTGGAGYIGAHIVRALRRAGKQVVVYDDLSSGFTGFVPDGVPVVVGSILDADRLRAAYADHDVTGVIHLAAKKYAGVSVEQPLLFYRENLTGTQVLLETMVDAGIDQLVFSSSAAVYGTPDVDLVTEDTPTTPESPYGETKLASEWLIRSTARVTGMRQTSLRYFNVVGSGESQLYDASPHNLFPMVLKALTEGRRPQVFGTDYATPDGSCVRDYIHVVDLAEAHVVAADRIERDHELSPIYNVGRGEGVSVIGIMETMRQVTGVSFDYDIAGRRPGDPARIVASADLIRKELEWEARHDLVEMVRSAWTSWSSEPTSKTQEG